MDRRAAGARNRHAKPQAGLLHRGRGSCEASSAVKPPRSVGSKRASTRPASMREKSSSALTSFSRRRPLRCVDLDQRARLPRPAAGSRGQQLFERTQHQRQRRAEFVADVGEEDRLGAIDLGQRLGPAPFLLIGLGIADRGADLAGDQVEEACVARRRTARNGLRPTTSTPVASGLAGRHDRQDGGLPGRLAPGAARQRVAEAGGQVGDGRISCLAQHLGDRPERARSSDRVAAPPDGPASIPQAPASDSAVAVRVRPDRAARTAGRAGWTASAPTLRSQASRQVRASAVPAASSRSRASCRSPITRLRVVAVGADDAAGAAVVVGNRAVGEGVVGLFGIAVALHDQELLLDDRCPPCRSWRSPASGRCRPRSPATPSRSAGRAPTDACRR